MPDVRIAQEADEEALFDLLKANHAENGVGPFSERLVRDAIEHATRKRGGIVGVIHGETEIIASAGLILNSWWYSDPAAPGATLLTERWVFVRPEHRDGACFDALWAWACGVADEMSDEVGYCIPLLLGVMATERVEAKLRLYSRKLPLAGGAFLYRPDERARN